MPKQYSKANLLAQVLKWISIRPRSTFETRAYLERVTKEHLELQEEINKIVDDLIELKLLDDHAFASWLVASRRRSHPRGTYLLRLELQQKGIPKDIIDDVLGNDSYDSQNEVKLALQAIDKVLTRYQSLPFFEIRKKIETYLLRRGFSWEIARTVIDIIQEKRLE